MCSTVCRLASLNLPWLHTTSPFLESCDKKMTEKFAFGDSHQSNIDQGVKRCTEPRDCRSFESTVRFRLNLSPVDAFRPLSYKISWTVSLAQFHGITALLLLRVPSPDVGPQWSKDAWSSHSSFLKSRVFGREMSVFQPDEDGTSFPRPRTCFCEMRHSGGRYNRDITT